MNRKVINCSAKLSLIEPFDPSSDNLAPWLTAQCREHHYQWILIQSLEGVLWGCFEHDALKFGGPSEDADVMASRLTSLLDPQNLIQVRSFSDTRELFVWRHKGNTLKGRVISDGENGTSDNARWNLCLDEDQLLWGDSCERVTANGISLLERGKGLQQWLPLSDTLQDLHSGSIPRCKLNVRHYLEECPESGQIVFVCGRLKGLAIA